MVVEKATHYHLRIQGMSFVMSEEEMKNLHHRIEVLLDDKRE